MFFFKHNKQLSMIIVNFIFMIYEGIRTYIVPNPGVRRGGDTRGGWRWMPMRNQTTLNPYEGSPEGDLGKLT